MFTLNIVGCAIAAERVYVYKDDGDDVNKGVWSSIMPKEAADTKALTFITNSPNGFGGKGTSVKIDFNLDNYPWAGLVAPVNDKYWGEKDYPGLDLSKMKKLVFYAKGDNGNEQIQVKAAFISNKPFGDSAILPVVSPWYVLTKDWKRYEIKLEDAQNNLKRVISPFSVITNNAHNPNGKFTVHIDEVFYE